MYYFQVEAHKSKYVIIFSLRFAIAKVEVCPEEELQLHA